MAIREVKLPYLTRKSQNVMVSPAGAMIPQEAGAELNNTMRWPGASSWLVATSPFVKLIRVRLENRYRSRRPLEIASHALQSDALPRG